MQLNPLNLVTPIGQGRAAVDLGLRRSPEFGGFAWARGALARSAALAWLAVGCGERSQATAPPLVQVADASADLTGGKVADGSVAETAEAGGGDGQGPAVDGDDAADAPSEIVESDADAAQAETAEPAPVDAVEVQDSQVLDAAPDSSLAEVADTQSELTPDAELPDSEAADLTGALDVNAQPEATDGDSPLVDAPDLASYDLVPQPETTAADATVTEADANATVDAQPAPGCKSNADCAKQEDGNFCNGTLYCVPGAGVCAINPSTIVVCDTSYDTVCNKIACAPATGKCAMKPVANDTPCDDGVKCTDGDVCAAGKCVAGTMICACKSAADCAKHEDGDACNGVLYCNKALGSCLVNPATAVTCPSVNDTACSKNLCKPETGQCAMTPVKQGGCDDGNPCTANETCIGGSCKASANVCQCQSDADCSAKEDGNVCNGTLYCDFKAFPHVCVVNPATTVVCPTADDTSCQARKCQPKTGQCPLVALPDNVTCEADGNPCTASDACQQGQCAVSANTCQCQSDADCAASEDGDLCNGTLYCNKQANKCAVNPATVVVCPWAGDTTCSVNTCDPQTGKCAYKAQSDGQACDADGNPCTVEDQCQTGACKAGANLCECQVDGDCAAKEDGNPCNGTLYCGGFPKKCLVNLATVVQCANADDAVCLRNLCDPTTGSCAKVAANSGKSCNGDDNPCTAGDACKAGVCAVGKNVCGCLVDGDCEDLDDGTACNGLLICDKAAQPFVCAVAKSTIVSCQAGSDTACAKNTCQPKTGKCALTAVAPGTLCDDGDPCTLGDACTATACAGDVTPCDDQNPCTSDSCGKGGACAHVPVVCQDGNPCTVDACQASGCVYLPTANTCSDSDACTTGDVCKDGKCAGGAKTVCSDGNACTADSCDAKGGCAFVALGQDVTCSDGNPCTTGDACGGGACVAGAASVCPGGQCDPANGTCACSDGYFAIAVDDAGIAKTACAPEIPIWGVLPMASAATIAVGDGTVLDPRTGLLWQQTPDVANTYAWSAAQSYCDTLVLGGKSDWRLPGVQELLALVSVALANPAIDKSLFANATLVQYWTALPDVAGKTFYVNFASGTVGTAAGSSDFHVRCVRTHKAAP